jgi:hypothetical protein
MEAFLRPHRRQRTEYQYNSSRRQVCFGTLISHVVHMLPVQAANGCSMNGVASSLRQWPSVATLKSPKLACGCALTSRGPSFSSAQRATKETTVARKRGLLPPGFHQQQQQKFPLFSTPNTPFGTETSLSSTLHTAFDTRPPSDREAKMDFSEVLSVP